MNTDKIYAESIAKEYAPKNHSKIVALRKLDRKAKLPANIFTYAFGIISALVFGTGMCLGMQVIGSGVPGIVIGIIGMIPVAFAYPTYNRILKKERQRIFLHSISRSTLFHRIFNVMRKAICFDRFILPLRRRKIFNFGFFL